ncbi:MAG: 3-phosphoglycerate dehydrogenase [Oscillospiraceae bacterium]|jgi:D-3-phosphoglycerate dehydrogenase|nr:3-phosphoglycerate dehydrogenase [Oscillospiraceae bacterium]
MPHKIKLLNKISPAVAEILGAGYDVSEAHESPCAIVVRSADMHSYARPASLLAIARAGAGVNNIPVEDCGKSGVVVFNTPGANANAVAELVVASMLLAGRDILGGANWVQTQTALDAATLTKTIEKEKSKYVGPELRGKTLGVIGLGAIGAIVANAAVGLGMDVVGFDPFISPEHAWSLSRSVRKAASIEDILCCADFITLHVPLVADTRGMISAAAIAKMKDGAALLNFSRGELVDSAALVSAVQSKKLRAYATDFPTPEMLGVAGIIALPHLGASTPESEENCAVMAAQELRDFIENGAIKNSVNLPDVALSAIPAGISRVTVIHKNTPGMLGVITAIAAADGVNIANLTNKSRGELAYTVLDIDGGAADWQTKLADAAGVLRVRVL